MKSLEVNKLIYSTMQVEFTLMRLASQIAELAANEPFLKIVAIQPRGILLANTLERLLKEFFNITLSVGKLDPSFYRDDIQSNNKLIIPEISRIDFEVRNQPILLIDDVLYTGRTARAAIEALLDLGRPKWVKFMVLVNRYMERELPVSIDFEGYRIASQPGQKVKVGLNEENKIEIRISNG